MNPELPTSPPSSYGQIGEPLTAPTAYAPAPPLNGKRGLIFRAVFGILMLFIIVFAGWKALPMLLPVSNEQVKLTYWGINSDEEAMKTVLADFTKENPNITVDYISQDPKQYRDRLLARIGNGTGPDLFRFHNTWVPMFQSVLLPLSNEVISPGSLKNEYYPVIEADLLRNGAVMGLPLQIDTLSLFTNTEILRAAGVIVPNNWNDFITISRQLTVVDESGKIRTSGAAMGTADNILNAPDIVSLLLAQSGVALSNIAEKPEKAIEVMDFYVSFGKAETRVWDTTLDPALLAFAKGNLAMYFGYARDIREIKSQNSSLQFAVSEVPILPDRKVSIASYYAEGISTKSPHPKEALKLMKYLAKKETLEKLHTEQIKKIPLGDLYPRVDMENKLTANPLALPFFKQAATAISTPFSYDAQESGMNAELNGYLNNAIRESLSASSSQHAIETLIQGQLEVQSRYLAVPEK